MVVTDWRKDANCYRREDINWDADEITLRHAELCLPCPVRQQCFDEALRRENRCDPGIWGGTTEMQRRAVRINRERGAELLAGFWAELAEAVG